MIDFLIYFLYGAAVGVIIIGFFFYLMNKPTKPDSKPDAPLTFAAHQLRRHELEVAICKDRFADDPEETIGRVKRDFARELVNILDDVIEVKKDERSRHIVFSVQIWTKEAADDRTEN